MIIFIDVDRSTDGGSRSYFHKLNVGTGEHSVISTNVQSFLDHAEELVRYVRHEKPSQVIFDTKGFGLGVKDSFVQLINIDNNIKIDANGKLYYAA